MFGKKRDWEPDHQIPKDGFEHMKSIACICGPEVKIVKGWATAIVHKRIEPKFEEVPEEWLTSSD